MSISRRDLFKVAGVATATAAITGCSVYTKNKTVQTVKSLATKLKDSAKGKRVVIIGGGFGGLTTAKYLKKADSSIEVIVLEKKDIFFSCPFSNAYLGGIEDVSLENLTYDLYSGATEYGYELIQSTVTSINRNNKTVQTNLGLIDYDILVLAPGIAYDYKGQFPTFSDDKIREISQKAPAAMMPGSEHFALKRMIDDMDDGNIIITKPAGKYRCPPAPFERASLLADLMKKEGIKGKVIILNENNKISKGAAFKESWKDLHSNLEHRANCKIVNVDFDKKEITYTQPDELDGTVTKTEKFAVLNLIPHNMANPIIGMSGVKADAWGSVKMAGASFRSTSDKSVYAVGDVVGHKIPPSGQTANWSGKQAAKEIADVLNNKTPKLDLPAKNANVCFSIVGKKPEEGIYVTHDFSFNGEVIKGKGNVPKTGGDKYRSKNAATLTRE